MNFNKIQRDNRRGMDTTQFLGNRRPQFKKTRIVSWNCSSQVHTFPNFLGEKPKKSFSKILIYPVSIVIVNVYQHFAKILIHPVLIVIVKDKKICKNS